MKKKNFIILALFLGLITISVGTYSILTENYEKTALTRNEIAEALEEKIMIFTYDAAQKTIPDYNALSLSSIDEKSGKALERSFSELLNSNYQTMVNDPLFNYWILDKENNIIKTNSQIEDIESIPKATQLFGDIAFNDGGMASLKGDSVAIDFSYTNRISQYIINTLNVEYDDYSLDLFGDSMEIVNPKNFRLIYAIQESDHIESLLIQNIDSNRQTSQFNNLSMTLLLSFSMLVILMTLLIPFNILSEVNPFKTIDTLSFETLVLFYGTTLVASVTGILFVLHQILVVNLSIINDLFEFIIVVSLLFIGYLLVAMVTHSIKKIFKEGFGSYFKNNTLVSKGIRGITNRFDSMFNIPLDGTIKRKVLSIVGLMIVVMSLLALLGPVGSVFILLMGVVIIYRIFHEISDILDSYHDTLDVVKEIAQGNFKDISEITAKDSTFGELNHELLKIQNGFEKAVTKERQAQTMRTDLITNVSHDLKTPITGIQSYVELLEDEVNDDNLMEYVLQLKHYVSRLNTLILDVFDLSEVNSGTLNLNYTDINIIELIEQVMVEFSESFEHRNLEVVWDYESKKVMCYLDGDKTYRIIENLFSNVAKYAMPHSRVYVRVESLDSCVCIEIKNISEKKIEIEQKQLKERFVRGETSRTIQGNGLGLSIADSFTKAQNGTFDVVIDGDLFKVILMFKHAQDEPFESEA